jgi:hypothetical protein
MSERIAHAAALAAAGLAARGAAGMRAAGGAAFAKLLDGFAEPLWNDASAHRAASGDWRTDGAYQVKLPRNGETHVLVWRATPGGKPLVVEPLLLRQSAQAWERLLPAPDENSRKAVAAGFAVMDDGGVRAEYEFLWRFVPGAGWRADPDPHADDPAMSRVRPAPFAAVGALDPIVARDPSAWLRDCGRCKRYTLGRRDLTLTLLLCPHDCLKPGEPG